MMELDKTGGQWTKGKRKGATLDSYPTLFLELLKRGSQEKVGLECGTPEGARRFMGKLNAFKGAVYRIARTDEDVKVWEVMVRQVYMTVEGAKLWLMPRAMEPDNLVIAAALGIDCKPKVLPIDRIQVGAEESLKMVMAMLEKDQHGNDLPVALPAALEETPEMKAARMYGYGVN